MCVVLTERRNRPDPDDDRPGYPKHVICSFAHLHPRKSISSSPTSKFLTSRFTAEPLATADQAIGFFEPYPSLVTISPTLLRPRRRTSHKTPPYQLAKTFIQKAGEHT